MNQLIETLTIAAARWQQYHNRDLGSILGKIQDEVDEAKDAEWSLDFFDEIGDILVNAFRFIHALNEEERIFVSEVVAMKVRRRLDNPGFKDKKAEFDEMLEIAKGVFKQNSETRRQLNNE